MTENRPGLRLLFTGSDSEDSLPLLNSLFHRLTLNRQDIQIHGLFFPEGRKKSITTGGYLFPVRLLSLDETLEEPYSDEAIDAYTDFVSSSSYSNLRYDGLKLLNRNDLSGTFRVLEREVYLQSSMLALFTLLLTLRPNLLVFPVSPHLFLPFVAARLAEVLGIEVLHFQPCPGAPVALPKLTKGTLVNSGSGHPARPDLPEEIAEMFDRSILRLQASKDPAYMEMQRARDTSVLRLSSKLRALFWSFRWLFSDRFQNSISFSGHRRRIGIFRRGLELILQRSLERELREKVHTLGSALNSEPYCIFAMHYEPERTSFPEGLPVRSQLDAVAIARNIVPPELRLLVKEHYSQKSSALRGILGRSPLAYELIDNFPRTDFLAADDKLTELIPGAACVFTLTGSIAIEAAFAGVPVAYFGNPWWDGLPGTTKIGAQSNFESILKVPAPEPEAVFQFLSSLVRSSAVPTSGGEKVSEIEKRVGKLPLYFRESEADALSSVILRLLADIELSDS